MNTQKEFYKNLLPENSNEQVDASVFYIKEAGFGSTAKKVYEGAKSKANTAGQFGKYLFNNHPYALGTAGGAAAGMAHGAVSDIPVDKKGRRKNTRTGQILGHGFSGALMGGPALEGLSYLNNISKIPPAMRNQRINAEAVASHAKNLNKSVPSPHEEILDLANGSQLIGKNIPRGRDPINPTSFKTKDRVGSGFSNPQPISNLNKTAGVLNFIGKHPVATGATIGGAWGGYKASQQPTKKNDISTPTEKIVGGITGGAVFGGALGGLGSMAYNGIKLNKASKNITKNVGEMTEKLKHYSGRQSANAKSLAGSPIEKTILPDAVHINGKPVEAELLGRTPHAEHPDVTGYKSRMNQSKRDIFENATRGRKRARTKTADWKSTAKSSLVDAFKKHPTLTTMGAYGGVGALTGGALGAITPKRKKQSRLGMIGKGALVGGGVGLASGAALGGSISLAKNQSKASRAMEGLEAELTHHEIPMTEATRGMPVQYQKIKKKPNDVSSWKPPAENPKHQPESSSKGPLLLKSAFDTSKLKQFAHKTKEHGVKHLKEMNEFVTPLALGGAGVGMIRESGNHPKNENYLDKTKRIGRSAADGAFMGTVGGLGAWGIRRKGATPTSTTVQHGSAPESVAPPITKVSMDMNPLINSAKQMGGHLVEGAKQLGNQAKATAMPYLKGMGNKVIDTAANNPQLAAAIPLAGAGAYLGGEETYGGGGALLGATAGGLLGAKFGPQIANAAMSHQAPLFGQNIASKMRMAKLGGLLNQGMNMVGKAAGGLSGLASKGIGHSIGSALAKNPRIVGAGIGAAGGGLASVATGGDTASMMAMGAGMGALSGKKIRSLASSGANPLLGKGVQQGVRAEGAAMSAMKKSPSMASPMPQSTMPKTPMSSPAAKGPTSQIVASQPGTPMSEAIKTNPVQASRTQGSPSAAYNSAPNQYNAGGHPGMNSGGTSPYMSAPMASAQSVAPKAPTQSTSPYKLTFDAKPYTTPGALQERQMNSAMGEYDKYKAGIQATGGPNAAPNFRGATPSTQVVGRPTKNDYVANMPSDIMSMAKKNRT